jgi:branched-chain amino acid transport system permease protein
MMKPFALVLLLGAAALAVPSLGSEYAVSFTIQLLVFAILAYSWNLIGGYAGYSHFGQVCFFGLGGYVGALLVQKAGLPWYYAAPLAALAGIALAVPLGAAMLRLKGPYFAIGMFGLARVMESLVLGFDSVTQGGTGLYLKPLESLRPVYYTLVAIALAMIAATWRLDNSRLGLKLLAIREDEAAAEAMGVRTTRLKIGTFVCSAIAPAAVGALYAVYLGFIDPPTAFSPATELTTIAIVLLGGMGTVLGPLLGAVVLSVVNELLWARFPEHYLAIVGVMVLLAVLYMPRGIANLGAKKGWLPAGRGLCPQPARPGAGPEAAPRRGSFAPVGTAQGARVPE